MSRLQNTANVAVCLPPSVLTEMFLLLAVDADVEDADERPPYAWIRVTHVCRRWREVALQASNLWTNVTMTGNLDCAKAMLQRSQHASLTVRTPCHTGYHLKNAYRLIFPEIDRIAHLDLTVDDSTRIPMSSRATERLDTLVLRHTPNGRVGAISGSPMDKLYITGLKRLELRGYVLPWSHKLLKHRTLTHLSIVSGLRVPGLGVQTAALSTVLKALKGLPALEVLEFSNVLPDVPNSVLPTTRRGVASLVHLRKLSLEGTLLQCVQLMQHLAFPTTTQIDVACVGSYEAKHLIALASTIGEKLRGSKKTPGAPQVLRCASVVDAVPDFKAWSTAHSIEQVVDQLDTMPPHHVSITLRPAHAFALCQLLPLKDVQTFYLNPAAQFALAKHRWTAPLRNMPSIRQLGIGDWAGEGGPFPEVLAACVPCTSGPVFRGQRVALSVLPALDTILFKDVDFYHEGRDMRDNYEQMSAVRHCVGQPIKRIILRNPRNLKDGDVEWLKSLARDEFIWDSNDVVEDEDDSRESSVAVAECEDEYFDEFERGIFDGPEWDGKCYILF